MMSGVLGSVLSFIVAISVLVAVHEYGHYIVGKWSGMKVLKFSIGFGKPIWSKVAGPDQTEYCVSAIPLGGFVRFLDSREAAISPEDDGRAFDQRPVPLRIAVLLAGPAFNFLFAIAAYWIIFVDGVPSYVPSIGKVDEGSYAEEAGLENGDRIVSINDKAIVDWESALLVMIDSMVSTGSVPMTLESREGYRKTAVVQVGEDVRRLTEPGQLFEGLGFKPWTTNDLPAIIGEIVDGESAQLAGLQLGDRVTTVGGVNVYNFADMVKLVQSMPNSRVEFLVERGGASNSIYVDIGETEIGGQRVGRLGAGTGSLGADYVFLRQYGPAESVTRAIERTWDSTLFTVRMLSRMVTGDVSIKNISGPINIAQFAGESAERGLSSFLGFLAIVSISLGVLNLLPIPILDGGQIVYQAIEGIKGSPLSEQAQIVGQQVGIFALLILMSFAFYNDLARIFG